MRLRSLMIVISFALAAACGGSTNPDDGEPGLELLPDSALIAVSEQLQYAVEAFDSDGNPEPLTDVLTWSSEDTTVATIDSTGLATGVRPGITTIVVTMADRREEGILVVGTGSAACFGIASATEFSGTSDYAFLAENIEAENGFTYTISDHGELGPVVMTRLMPGPTQVIWSGDVNGTANVDQRQESDGDVTTYVDNPATIVAIPTIGFPKMSLIVDLTSCRYRFVAGASVNTRTTDPDGQVTNSIDFVAELQITGSIPSNWRLSGISGGGAVAAHSVLYLAQFPDSSALIPLGFAPALFNAEVSQTLGQASAEFDMVFTP